MEKPLDMLTVDTYRSVHVSGIEKNIWTEPVYAKQNIFIAHCSEVLQIAKCYTVIRKGGTLV
jgi:hypothetical protein